MPKFRVHVEIEFTYDGEIEADDLDDLREEIETNVNDYVVEHDRELHEEPGHVRVDIEPLDGEDEDDDADEQT